MNTGKQGDFVVYFHFILYLFLLIILKEMVFISAKGNVKLDCQINKIFTSVVS